MKTKYVASALVVLGLVGAPGVRAQFKPGHIFVSGSGLGECCCDLGDPEFILEIDPATGEVTVFGGCDDEVNGLSGLRFTPDGQRLLVINALGVEPQTPGWIQAFDPDGGSEIILDGSNGLAWPAGANGLAFDSDGNLYVVDRVLDAILRFPADGGPTTVFADANDGINDSGALAFAPNGDLFYTGTVVDKIIRITPEGKSSVFDSFDPLHEPRTLAFDRMGNLFVGATPVQDVSVIYRYDNADPKTRRILAKGVVPQVLVIALAPDDDSVLYVATGADAPNTFLFAVDPVDGSATPIAQVGPDVESIGPTGLAVFPVTVAGDMDGDGDVDIFDVSAFFACVGGPGVPVLPGCAAADLDGDGDADFHDFGRLQLAYGGP